MTAISSLCHGFNFFSLQFLAMNNQLLLNYSIIENVHLFISCIVDSEYPLGIYHQLVKPVGLTILI